MREIDVKSKRSHLENSFTLIETQKKIKRDKLWKKHGAVIKFSLLFTKSNRNWRLTKHLEIFPKILLLMNQIRFVKNWCLFVMNLSLELRNGGQGDQNQFFQSYSSLLLPTAS